MNAWAGKLRAWIAPRWDGPESLLAFLQKSLPRNVSWLHTLGSLLLVYILFQSLTGVLIAFYYNPSPDQAYDSLRFVQRDLFLGSLLVRLHRFGAGFIMVTAFLHFVRSYFFEAYKSPRELLWITGLGLGVLLSLFAFTGQLLPFDQRGYWATIVGIQIASSAPFFGDAIHALLTGGYGDIGATTLSRFYILHVCILPMALAGLLALHLKILQRTGSAGPLSGDPGPTHPFYPLQAAKDVLISAAGALLLILVALFVTSAESGPANPTAGNFVPRPEWYFLAHYEILKFLPGLIGAFVLPTAVGMFLLLLPFLNRGPRRPLRQRRFTTILGILACLSIVGLTAQGIVTAPASRQSESDNMAMSPIERGKHNFQTLKCITCHRIAGEGKTKGPDLTRVGRRLRPDYLRDWIHDPRNFDPSTEMPAFEGTEDELDAVVEYLLTLQ